MHRILTFLSACWLMLLHISPSLASPSKDELIFDDRPLNAPLLETPEWFTLSFLDLNESLKEVIDKNKKGLIIYFGREDCAYCKAQLEGNWGYKDIVNYTQKYFNVIGINVRGQKPVTDFNGKVTTEKNYSIQMKTNFTPSLLFYDKQGQLALKLPGYRPPYQFRASLEYVADKHYKKESFGQYLARAEQAFNYGENELNEHSSFKSVKYLHRPNKNKPLVVFFEQPKCHACDVMHADPMNEPVIIAQLKNFDVVQLDSTANTFITTPAGQKTTAKKWAEQLELNFSPTLVFFDGQGKEIIRISSVLRLYRMKNLLSYILSKGYITYPTFQSWQMKIFNNYEP